jgi:hypothetical protein
MHETPRHQPPALESVQAGYEVSDAHLRPVLATAIALVVVTGVVVLILWGLMSVLERIEQRTDPPRSPVASDHQQVPKPRLQPLIGLNDRTPAQDLVLMKQRNSEILGSYGWVDREKGIVRIPIEQAMKIVGERGLPTTQRSQP